MGIRRPHVDPVLQFSIDREPASGVLLAAAPNLQDGHFRRKVVFVCEHNSDGSFGLVLNAPLPLRLAEVIDRHRSRIPLSMGGPVQPQTLHFLHRRPGLDVESREVCPGIFWGGDFERALRLIEKDLLGSDEIRFFAGYSGWSARQLGEEMKQSSWYPAPATPELVFADPPPGDEDELWKTVLRTLGPKYEILFDYPPDPVMN